MHARAHRKIDEDKALSTGRRDRHLSTLRLLPLDIPLVLNSEVTENRERRRGRKCAELLHPGAKLNQGTFLKRVDQALEERGAQKRL